MHSRKLALLLAEHRQLPALADAWRQLEGINNKIKMVRRNAYGWRDSDYFFL